MRSFGFEVLKHFAEDEQDAFMAWLEGEARSNCHGVAVTIVQHDTRTCVKRRIPGWARVSVVMADEWQNGMWVPGATDPQSGSVRVPSNEHGPQPWLVSEPSLGNSERVISFWRIWYC